ncbi:MAG TPA: hypothetical protein VFR48_02380 [Solirubrobacteraceae bacterium]|nr:hypothetical protein [Solirubrobacteraceae bacterium]
MDREVARTLGELELKLRELERELTSIGRRASDPPPRAPLPPQQHSSPPPPPVQPAMPAPGRIVDEALEFQSERRYSMEAQETAFGEIPATKDERETIDLAELVRFKHTMQETLEGLIGEYSRLLSLRAPSGD